MINTKEIEIFESELNSFDVKIRKNALSELCDIVNTGKYREPELTDAHNLHCHTFYSYNGYGYSPSYIAWLTKKSGWFAGGIVDFDVLDGVDEFIHAGMALNIRSTAGIETRVFIESLAGEEINSPGEPGIAYHMGVGFNTGKVSADNVEFLKDLRAKASGRTQQIVALVNTFLAPVCIDFDKDAAVLTPNGNVTERHACCAYRVKAETVFPNLIERIQFWSQKLGIDAADAAKVVDNPVKLEAAIRAKTMKKGGVGYVQADKHSFPALHAMNKFIEACGALPTIAWLDGGSSGEQNVERLLQTHVDAGGVILNIIPDRNWNFADANVKAKKVNELNRIMAAAAALDIPVIAGTEMNAPGQKLVDDFDNSSLTPHFQTFVDGAAIVFAHTVLSRENKGYLSDWAVDAFPCKCERNKYFAEFGRQHRWS
jgi:hypothetical protein